MTKIILPNDYVEKLSGTKLNFKSLQYVFWSNFIYVTLEQHESKRQWDHNAKKLSSDDSKN